MRMVLFLCLYFIFLLSFFVFFVLIICPYSLYVLLSVLALAVPVMYVFDYKFVVYSILSSRRPLCGWSFFFHTCHILPPSEIDLGLCLAVFAGSGGKYLFHRIGWKGRIWQLCVCLYYMFVCVSFSCACYVCFRLWICCLFNTIFTTSAMEMVFFLCLYCILVCFSFSCACYVCFRLWIWCLFNTIFTTSAMRMVLAPEHSAKFCEGFANISRRLYHFAMQMVLATELFANFRRGLANISRRPLCGWSSRPGTISLFKSLFSSLCLTIV